MKTKTLRQSVTFKATAHDVYETLMDSRKHGRFTQAKARISRKVGGKIFTFDRFVNGTKPRACPGQKNRPILAGKRLAQGSLFQGDLFAQKSLRAEPASSSLNPESQRANIITLARVGTITIGAPSRRSLKNRVPRRHKNQLLNFRL